MGGAGRQPLGWPRDEHSRSPAAHDQRRRRPGGRLAGHRVAGAERRPLGQPDAKAAVDAAIKKTGYRVNPHARSLATNRTGSVAFLLTEDHQQLFEDPNFSALLKGTAAALAESEMSLVLIMAGSSAEQKRAVAYIEAGHVDGVLLVSAHSGQRLLADIVGSGVPAIACGIPLGYQRRMGYVAADDEEGAREMVAHLRSLGRRRIATIAGPLDTPAASPGSTATAPSSATTSTSR